MTYYVIAVDHNLGTKEKPVMRTDYVDMSYTLNRITPYQSFNCAKHFESIDEAKLFFENNKEDILKHYYIWGEPSNPRIVRVKSTDCLSLV